MFSVVTWYYSWTFQWISSIKAIFECFWPLGSSLVNETPPRTRGKKPRNLVTLGMKGLQKCLSDKASWNPYCLIWIYIYTLYTYTHLFFEMASWGIFSINKFHPEYPFDGNQQSSPDIIHAWTWGLPCGGYVTSIATFESPPCSSLAPQNRQTWAKTWGRNMKSRKNRMHREEGDFWWFLYITIFIIIIICFFLRSRVLFVKSLDLGSTFFGNSGANI